MKSELSQFFRLLFSILFFELQITLIMDYLLIWDPLSILEMGAGPREQGNICCGTTKKRDSCKSSVKIDDLKAGRQQLRALGERY